jgi:hypothetical protein
MVGTNSPFHAPLVVSHEPKEHAHKFRPTAVGRNLRSISEPVGERQQNFGSFATRSEATEANAADSLPDGGLAERRQTVPDLGGIVVLARGESEAGFLGRVGFHDAVLSRAAALEARRSTRE